MAKTVRDIMLNVDSGDLLLSTGDINSHLVFNIVWGGLFSTDNANTLYANIIIPSRKLSKLVADDQGRYLIYANAVYYPYETQFIVRLILDNNGVYQKIQQSNCVYPVESRAFFPNSQTRINASELPSINIDGNYLFELKFGQSNTNNAYVYTADSTDLLVDGSDLQASKLLSICEPGKYYRHPTAGISAYSYIGSVVSHTDLGDRIIEQFRNNEVSVQDAEFNARTGELQLIFFNEAVEEELGFADVSELNTNEIDITDSELNAIETDIELEDYDMSYEELIPDYDISQDVSMESCFANGVWIRSNPWTRNKLWKEND